MNQTQESFADSKGVDTETLPEVVEKPMLTEVSKPRDSVGMRVLSIFVLALAACLAVAGGWRRGYVLAPTDALKIVAPWRVGSDDFIPANENLLDQTVQFVPWTIYAVERYRQHQIPLWNPNSQLGAPFLGNGQSAIFYPTILLHWFLPETWSWTISAALRLFIAGLGLYLLAGRYGLRGVPRLLSAVAFMLCGFNVVWLNHPQMNVMPLLPWAVLMTEMLIERVALHRILGAALVFFVQFLGGHPASCIHLLLACFLVWGLRIIWPGETRSASGAAKRVFALTGILAAIVLGFALAAAQWLPLIEYAHYSGGAIVRQNNLKLQPAIAADPRYLIGMAFPYANGYPDGVAPFEMRKATHLPNTNELVPAFVGTIPLVLGLFAMVGLWRKPTARVWTIIALISAAIAIKLPGVDHIVRLVPALNVAQNARLLVVTALAMALLAGFGLDHLILLLRQGVDPARLRKTLKWSAIAFAGIAVLASATLLIAKNPILNWGNARAEADYKNGDTHEHSLASVKVLVERTHKELLLTSVRLLIPATLLATAALLLWANARKGGGLASSAFPWFVLALADLLVFAVPYNRGAPAYSYFPSEPVVHATDGSPGATTEDINAVAIRTLSGLPHHRFAATFRTFAPETSSAYNLPDIRGYDALAPARYYKWWKHPGIGDLPDTQQGYLSRLENPEHKAWSLLNFGYLLTAADQPPPPADKFKLIENGDEDAHLYEAKSIRPRAWVVPRAQVYESIDPVLDRIAKMDFNPDELVLLDKEVAYDSKELIEAAPKFWEHIINAPAAGKSSVTFVPAPRKEGDRPEVIHLNVSSPGGGYLVLADTYFPGWTARITGGVGGPQDVPILPANGVMRAIALPAVADAQNPLGSTPSLSIEMRYRPWSWRIGAAVSCGSVLLFLILIGFTLINGRSRATEGDPWPK